MRDLGPVRETDRLLDALGSRQDVRDDHDAVVSMLAAWTQEIDPSPSAGLAVVGATAPRRHGRRGRRLAAGTLLVAVTMSGTSIAAALTGAQLPVLTSMGEALVGVVPGGAHLLALDDEDSDSSGEAGAPAGPAEAGLDPYVEPQVGQVPLDGTTASDAFTDPAPDSPGLSAVGRLDVGVQVLPPATSDPGDRPGAGGPGESVTPVRTAPVEPVDRVVPPPALPGPPVDRPNPPPVHPGPPVDRPNPPPVHPGPPVDRPNPPPVHPGPPVDRPNPPPVHPGPPVDQPGPPPGRPGPPPERPGPSPGQPGPPPERPGPVPPTDPANPPVPVPPPVPPPNAPQPDPEPDPQPEPGPTTPGETDPEPGPPVMPGPRPPVPVSLPGLPAL